MMMEIKLGNNKFYIGDDENHTLADINFDLNSNERYLVNRTFVDPVLRGQGVARKLVMRMVEHARNTGKKIVPVCSYVIRVYQEDPSIKDTLAEESFSILEN